MSYWVSTFESISTYVNRQHNPYYGLYGWAYSQNPLIISSQYNLLTLDTTLALLGGYAAVVWFLLQLTVSSYQDFAYKHSLLKLLYTRKRPSCRHNDYDDDTAEVQEHVKHREPMKFSYFDYLSAKLVSSCCRCFRQKDWY